MSKRQKIEAVGYRVMTVAEFLEETPAESAHIEIGLALSDALKARRLELGLPRKRSLDAWVLNSQTLPA